MRGELLMYSLEDRIKAVKLYIKYGKSAAAVIRELGYPNRHSLASWYKEYVNTNGNLPANHERKGKFTKEQIDYALNFYLTHGRREKWTVKMLGYPGITTFRCWLRQRFGSTGKFRINHIQYTQEQKQEAVIKFLIRETKPVEIAKEYGIDRSCLYAWAKELLGKEYSEMPKKDLKQPLPDDITELQAQVTALKRQIYELQLEKDILEKAAEIIKKDPGVDLKKLKNKEKRELIDALKDKYPLPILFQRLHIAKSSYYYQRKTFALPDKYQALKETITVLFNENRKCYGYRRIWASLKQIGTTVSEKVIRRLMAQLSLFVKIRRKSKYRSYKGEDYPSVPNIINRDFHADAPNKKWLTDITEFAIPKGKVYLSPIIDCFDGLVVSWTIGTSPNAELVNTMLDNAILTLHDNEKPLIHSDRGFHYRLSGWIERAQKANITRSMSKKGCSPDNAACEGFFGRLKNELFYPQKWTGTTIDAFIQAVDDYIVWYNEKRIKMTLGGLSPMEYRAKLGLL